MSFHYDVDFSAAIPVVTFLILLPISMTVNMFRRECRSDDELLISY